LLRYNPFIHTERQKQSKGILNAKLGPYSPDNVIF
jgi:hypothetical protein